jgi:hypothetical protein
VRLKFWGSPNTQISQIAVLVELIETPCRIGGLHLYCDRLCFASRFKKAVPVFFCAFVNSNGIVNFFTWVPIAKDNICFPFDELRVIFSLITIEICDLKGKEHIWLSQINSILLMVRIFLFGLNHQRIWTRQKSCHFKNCEANHSNKKY